jgi:ankyrin repeat protein
VVPDRAQSCRPEGLLRQQLKRLENCAHRVDRWLTIKHTLLTLAVTSLLTTTAFADPIHDAAMNGDIAGVTTELHKGVDVNAKDKWGGTPLHWAANRGHEEVAELLIANGADVNLKDDYGRTPLKWAVRHKHTETADLLRKHGGKTGEELKAEGK